VAIGEAVPGRRHPFVQGADAGLIHSGLHLGGAGARVRAGVIRVPLRLGEPVAIEVLGG
jgi:hypothetical protein